MKRTKQDTKDAKIIIELMEKEIKALKEKSKNRFK